VATGAGGGADSCAHDLVFAIAHEIGNHLGAVRLQAHLLDEDLDVRALAQASVEIDGLAGRAGPMLALLRPLLRPGSPSAALAGRSASWGVFFAAIKQHLEDEGTRGVSVEIAGLGDSGPLAPNVDWLHSLLVVLLDATLAMLPRDGTIRIGVDSRDEESVFFIEDNGREEDLSPAAALRGRPLAVALARELLQALGGRVETSRTGPQTRVELVFSDPK
jgi:hypothetical protein